LPSTRVSRVSSQRYKGNRVASGGGRPDKRVTILVGNIEHQLTILVGNNNIIAAAKCTGVFCQARRELTGIIDLRVGDLVLAQNDETIGREQESSRKFVVQSRGDRNTSQIKTARTGNVGQFHVIPFPSRNLIKRVESRIIHDFTQLQVIGKTLAEVDSILDEWREGSVEKNSDKNGVLLIGRSKRNSNVAGKRFIKSSGNTARCTANITTRIPGGVDAGC